MKVQKLLPFLFTGAIAVSMMTVVSSCNKSDDNNDPTPPSNSGILQGDISGNRSLTADSVYTIKGYVYVKDGGVLTIPAGTVLKSDVIEKGAVIVERGGKLMAEGTSSKPIVFTSGLPKGQRRPGDWGGIILLGKAPTNRATEPTIEGGVNRNYGGSDANDNSGVLKYVRIEFAGIAAAPGSEINGLTLGGVGAGTTIENVMVSYGNDDGYEFFGGTVNCKNLIAFSCLDDDFDFDYGYTGKIQYGIGVKNPLFSDAADASNGVEADNDGSGTSATPFTRPVLSNFTFVGPNKSENLTHNYANRWRRAVRFVLRNSILMAYPKAGFSMESNETVAAYQGGQSEFKNNIVHSFAAPFKVSSGAPMTEADVETMALSQGTVKLAAAADVKLTDPFKMTAVNVTPAAGSPALSGASFTSMDAFFQVVTFRGAVGTTDWTQGWANWDPNNTDY